MIILNIWIFCFHISSLTEYCVHLQIYCCVITLHTIELPDICLSLLKGPILPRWSYSKIHDARALFIGRVLRHITHIFYIYTAEMFPLSKHVQYSYSKYFLLIFSLLWPARSCKFKQFRYWSASLILCSLSWVGSFHICPSQNVHKSIQP